MKGLYKNTQQQRPADHPNLSSDAFLGVQASAAFTGGTRSEGKAVSVDHFKIRNTSTENGFQAGCF